MTSNKIPTPITDKNGKQTTVHKNPDIGKPANDRINSLKPTPTTQSPTTRIDRKVIDNAINELNKTFPGIAKFEASFKDGWGDIYGGTAYYENQDSTFSEGVADYVSGVINNDTFTNHTDILISNITALDELPPYVEQQEKAEGEIVFIFDINKAQQSATEQNDDSESDFKKYGIRPFVLHQTEESRIQQQIADLKDWSSDIKSVVPEASTVFIKGNSSGEPYVASVKDDNNKDIWDNNPKHHNAIANHVERLDRFVRNLNIQGGVDKGYLTPEKDGFKLNLTELEKH